jgi:hypothetical protein
MKIITKQDKWEIFFAMLAVGIMVGVAIAGIGYAVLNIDITPHQVYTVDGVQYDCAFPAPDVMECEQVDDPDVGGGRQP